MYDLLVKNGLVANEYHVLPLDVAVQEEKVVALASHGALDAIGAQHVIDAQGKYVLPGGIDPHVHYDLSVSAAMTAQSPVAGSRAGLYGGTTAILILEITTYQAWGQPEVQVWIRAQAP